MKGFGSGETGEITTSERAADLKIRELAREEGGDNGFQGRI
jgi:hypothetical protein